MSDLHIAEVIGGAGTGKTTMMKNAVLAALERPETGGNPMSIGFSSFTRAARREAASRVGDELRIDPSILERDGWFRTAHSVAYRQLGVSRGELIVGKEGDRWVSEALGSDVSTAIDDEEEGGVRLYIGDEVAAAALNYWSYARATLLPLRAVVEADTNPEAPPADEVVKRIVQYESKKRLEARCDFTDLLCRYAGVYCAPEGGVEEVTPEGAVPDEVVGWIFDEAQDASALLDRACRRLVTGDACKWVWLVGDPFQCQPAGTPVLTTTGYKAIESLDPRTDKLLAYSTREGRFYGKSRRIPFQTASRIVDSGNLIEITLEDGTTHISTDNHKWVCRTRSGNWYATYLMRKGSRWRVGTVQMFSRWSENAKESTKDKNSGFRFLSRMHQEQADEGWILSIHKTDRDARLHEQIVSAKYGISQVTFRPPQGSRNNLTKEFIDAVFDALGDIRHRADWCLNDHGRSIDFPYIKKSSRGKNGNRACRFIEACNLLPQITMFPKMREGACDMPASGKSKDPAHRRATRSPIDWVPVTAVRRLEPGTPTPVFSLNVEKHHTYITENRYITGNCIHGWAGADSSNFTSWGAKTRKIMPKSYRCPAPMLQLGERCLMPLADYWDRKIAPADHDGVVVESENFEDDLADLDPTVETLVLARTNRNVGRIAAILDDIGVPYRKTKSREGTLNRDIGMAGLWRLQHGEHITGEQWTQAIDMLPSKSLAGQVWLARGAKAAWNKGLKDTFDLIYPEELDRVGATADLRAVIADGKWPELVDGGQKWTRAAARWGVESVEHPKIRIGTAHSSKGMEADHVVVLTSVGRKIRQGEEDDPRRFAEERRLEYVAVTRARKKLVVAHDPRERHRMELPL